MCLKLQVSRIFDEVLPAIRKNSDFGYILTILTILTKPTTSSNHLLNNHQ
jgi:hypothetical protein